MGKSFFNVLRKIILTYGDPFILKLYEDISIEESLDNEIFCISCVGRKDLKTGPLYNRTSGGDGHRDLSPEANSLLSEKLSTAMTEYYKSDSSRKKTSVAMTGREFSETTKNKMRESKLGKKASDETKNKMRQAKKKVKKSNKKIPRNTERKGEKHPLLVLTEKQVIEIKHLLSKKYLSQRAIGMIYGVSQGQIHRIHTGKSWSHVVT